MTRGGSPCEGIVGPDSVRSRTMLSRKPSTLISSKHGVASSSTVHELLECPVCTNIMYPPIHQCPNGHTLCAKCKPKMRYCPICRQELGNIRCLALERIAETLEVPCTYEVLGCRETFPYQSRLSHEQSCTFRPFNCPYAGTECPFTGNIPMLLQHLKSHHQVDMHDGSTFNHRYVKSDPQDFENATWMLTLFNCYGHQFCLHFEAFNLGMTPVYMAFIRFMGEECDARKFSYCLEVAAGPRRLIWQGVPRSIRDSHKAVRDSLDGLIIHKKVALTFSGGSNQELRLKVAGRIWRV